MWRGRRCHCARSCVLFRHGWFLRIGWVFIQKPGRFRLRSFRFRCRDIIRFAPVTARSRIERTRQACLDRQPSPVSSPAERYHNTHASPTTRTHRHPALTSRGIHHIECSPLHLCHLTFAPPLLHLSATACAPRGKHARAQAHAVSLCGRVLLSVFAWMCGR